MEEIFLPIFMSFYCFIWIIPVGIGLTLTAFWIWMLVDALQRPDKKYTGDNDKIIWILAIIFTQWLGAVLYYLIIKRKDEKK